MALELRQLAGFVAVAEERSFYRAAKRLFVSQPALSRLVKRLEAELGITLLDRSTRHVELTPGGRILFAEARDVLFRVDRAAKSARRASLGRSGLLSVAYEDSTQGIVAAAARSFRQRMPDVELVVSPIETGFSADELRQHEVDLVVGRAGVDDHGFESWPLFQEPTVAATAASQHLGSAMGIEGSAIGIELAFAIGGASLVVPRTLLPHLRQSILALWQEAGVAAPTLQEAPSLAAALVMVSAGLGVAIVPASAALATGAGDITYRSFLPNLPVGVVVSRPRSLASSTPDIFIEALGATAPRQGLAAAGSAQGRTTGGRPDQGGDLGPGEGPVSVRRRGQGTGPSSTA